jgi:hypothetical protein
MKSRENTDMLRRWQTLRAAGLGLTAAGVFDIFSQQHKLPLKRSTTTSFSDFHNAPRRQYVVVMSGAMEIEISDGTTRHLVPGDVLVAEDLTGKGHITRGVGADPRISLAVPLAG